MQRLTCNLQRDHQPPESSKAVRAYQKKVHRISQISDRISDEWRKSPLSSGNMAGYRCLAMSGGLISGFGSDGHKSWIAWMRSGYSFKGGWPSGSKVIVAFAVRIYALV